jgi:putative flippase GtrA
MIFIHRHYRIAFVAGFLAGVCTIPTVVNSFGVTSASFFAALVIVMASGAPFGLSVFNYISTRTKRAVFSSIGKFAVVGVLNTMYFAGVISFFVLVTGISSGNYIHLFYVVAYITGVTNSFIWNKFWTFDGGGEGKAAHQFFYFCTVSLIALLVVVAIEHTLVNVMGPPSGVSKEAWPSIVAFITTPVSFSLNFTLYRLVVFRKKLTK